MTLPSPRAGPGRQTFQRAIFTTVDAKTAPLVISEMVGAIDGVDWGILFAAATLQLVPILVFVLLVQKYLIAGMTAGTTKG